MPMSNIYNLEKWIPMMIKGKQGDRSLRRQGLREQGFLGLTSVSEASPAKLSCMPCDL